MSTILSPKTGRLVKVGSKSYEELVRDPKYRDMMLNPSSHKNIPEGKAIPSAPKHSRPLRNVSNLPNVPKVATPPKMALPPLGPPRSTPQIPALPKSPVYSPSSPSVSLENIPMPIATPPSPLKISMNSTPDSSSALKIPLKPGNYSLPAIPSPKVSPLPSVPSLKLPKITSKAPLPPKMVLPPSPKLPLPPSPKMALPSSPKLPLPPSPKMSSPPSPKLPSPPKMPLPASPKMALPLPSKLPLPPKLPSPPLPSSPSQTFVPLHEVYDVNDEELEDILSMPFFDIPTLEKTLETTRQPARRAKIQAMIDAKKEQEGRGMKTRSWAARSPTRGRERHQLHQECGDKCFLLPESEKFPICASPRTTGGKSVCKVDCQGVQAAKVRAAQYKYPEVERKADALLKSCNREGDKHFKPSKALSPARSPVKVPSPRRSPSAKMAGKIDYGMYGEKEELMMPRRVARRTGRRTAVAVNSSMNYDHHMGDRHDRDRHDRERMYYEHHDRHDRDYKDRYNKDKMNWERDRHSKDNKNVEKEGEHYRMMKEKYVKLSPSMSRLGSDQKKVMKVEEDCGCGK